MKIKSISVQHVLGTGVVVLSARWRPALEYVRPTAFFVLIDVLLPQGDALSSALIYVLNYVL